MQIKNLYLRLIKKPAAFFTRKKNFILVQGYFIKCYYYYPTLDTAIVEIPTAIAVTESKLIFFSISLQERLHRGIVAS